MANLFQWLRWVHVAAGGLALILFWIPAIARKGGRTHVRAGWFYVVCMCVVVVTAFTMSGLAFTITLAIRRIAQPLSPEALADFLRGQRLSATFLAYLAGVTLASGWQGIWSVQTKREPKSMRTPFSLALNTLVLLAGLTVFVLGIKYRSGPLLALSPLGPPDWRRKFALLAARPTIAHALVVCASQLDDRHGHRGLYGFPGVRCRTFASFGRPKPALHHFLGIAGPGRRACHLRDGGLLSTQVSRNRPRIRYFHTTSPAEFLNLALHPRNFSKGGLRIN